MKKSTQEILHQAGIGDWLKSLKDTTTDLVKGKPSIRREDVGDWFKSLKDTTTDLVKGKPSIRREDVESLEQFQEQSQALSEMLDNLVKRLSQFQLSGNWGFEGENGKTTLENTADHLKQFTQALQTDYEVRDEAPEEDVK